MPIKNPAEIIQKIRDCFSIPKLADGEAEYLTQNENVILFHGIELASYNAEKNSLNLKLDDGSTYDFLLSTHFSKKDREQFFDYLLEKIDGYFFSNRTVSDDEKKKIYKHVFEIIDQMEIVFSDDLTQKLSPEFFILNYEFLNNHKSKAISNKISLKKFFTKPKIDISFLNDKDFFFTEKEILSSYLDKNKKSNCKSFIDVLRAEKENAPLYKSPFFSRLIIQDILNKAKKKNHAISETEIATLIQKWDASSKVNNDKKLFPFEQLVFKNEFDFNTLLMALNISELDKIVYFLNTLKLKKAIFDKGIVLPDFILDLVAHRDKAVEKIKSKITGEELYKIIREATANFEKIDKSYRDFLKKLEVKSENASFVDKIEVTPLSGSFGMKSAKYNQIVERDKAGKKSFRGLYFNEKIQLNHIKNNDYRNAHFNTLILKNHPFYSKNLLGVSAKILHVHHNFHLGKKLKPVLLDEKIEEVNLHVSFKNENDKNKSLTFLLEKTKDGAIKFYSENNTDLKEIIIDDLHRFYDEAKKNYILNKNISFIGNVFNKLESVKPALTLEEKIFSLMGYAQRKQNSAIAKTLSASFVNHASREKRVKSENLEIIDMSHTIDDHSNINNKESDYNETIKKYNKIYNKFKNRDSEIISNIQSFFYKILEYIKIVSKLNDFGASAIDEQFLGSLKNDFFHLLNECSDLDVLKKLHDSSEKFAYLEKKIIKQTFFDFPNIKENLKKRIETLEKEKNQNENIQTPCDYLVNNIENMNSDSKYSKYLDIEEMLNAFFKNINSTDVDKNRIKKAFSTKINELDENVKNEIVKRSFYVDNIEEKSVASNKNRLFHSKITTTQSTVKSQKPR